MIIRSETLQFNADLERKEVKSVFCDSTAWKMDLTTGNDWIARTARGELCSLIGCEEIPTIKCHECRNYFCDEHFKNHFH